MHFYHSRPDVTPSHVPHSLSFSSLHGNLAIVANPALLPSEPSSVTGPLSINIPPVATTPGLMGGPGSSSGGPSPGSDETK